MIDDLDSVDSVSSDVNSSRQETLLCVFEDRERSSAKRNLMGRSPHRHVSGTHKVALDWLFDRINLDSEIQIKYIDTKNQLVDMLTKGNFTRDERNHLLRLFKISYFSSTNCLEVMSKRTQQDPGSERVTSKSKPMMNLVSRCSEKNPDVLASTASESPEKTRHECQLFWARELSNITERRDLLRTLIPLRMECWRKMVFSRVEVWWSDGNKNGETCYWTTTRFVHTAHGPTHHCKR